MDYVLALSEWIQRNYPARRTINMGAHDGTFISLRNAFRDDSDDPATFPTRAELDTIWTEIEPDILAGQEADASQSGLRDKIEQRRKYIKIVKDFDDAHDVLLNAGAVTPNNLYDSWRAIYDGLNNNDKTAIKRYEGGFSLIDLDNEPLLDLTAYKVLFNLAIRRFMIYIIASVSIN